MKYGYMSTRVVRSANHSPTRAAAEGCDSPPPTDRTRSTSVVAPFLACTPHLHIIIIIMCGPHRKLPPGRDEIDESRSTCHAPAIILAKAAEAAAEHAEA